MLKPIKQRWKQFKAYEPGTRFQAQHRKGHSGSKSPFARGLRATLAIIVTLLGLVMMPAPGPGMPIVAIGLTMLANESLMVARVLDASELKLRPYVLRVIAWWQRRRPSRG